MDRAPDDDAPLLQSFEADDSAQPAPAKTGQKTDPRLRDISPSALKDLSAGIRERFGKGPPDPDDVAQEAYRRVLEKEDTSSIHNLKGFLWRTARNLVLDILKSEQSRSKYDFEVEQIFFPMQGNNSSPETVILAREQLKAINEVLRTMPDKRRRAFMLYRVEGLTQAEVARRLKISRPMVTKYIAAAHADISALFVDDAEG